MFQGKNVVLGVSGGIAVYKACDIVSKFRKLSINVDVIMTKSATEFVRPLTFASMSQNPVTSDMFEEPKDWDIEHIALAQKADVFLIAPATANIIGKIACGIADDMLSTTVMATKAKVIFAPAMNTQMYLNPIVNENIKKLKKLGYEFISPGEGRLACGDIGPGKLADTEDIVEYVKNELSIKKDLKGKRILITAGPTIEKIDPVRFLTNHSSGKMGYKLAEAARKRGAEVTLISGPTNLERPQGINLIDVLSTEEMYEMVLEHFKDTDILIKSAAPSDYKVKKYSENKIKKASETLNIELVKNPDILKKCGEIKTNQQLIGFAAESQNLEDNAIAKLKKKNLDMIIANNILDENAGFKSDKNKVTLFKKDGFKKEYPLMTKENLANIILDNI
ncbi:MAG: bifunctional phosphopantothenoylcysteine decarboxylase/phosphopantothenate--cysteine ligase CoaBC [Senegalia sp. (in: firmicutes)]|uniref:bifunctional phosphopantothenoylcysteine decarboxylase/phosphopantothenate--cysteine ligase CoaBC n=1 Tax=Senegalia sp. (in: firmicutes) TaxID=1924098 RepID=UPI003F9ABE32